MKKSFRDRITSLGLSFPKEMLIIFSIIILFVGGAFAVYFYFKELYISIIIGVGGFILVFFYISRYSNLEREIEKNHVRELISLLNYFEIFISNKNNVYTSLKMLIPYSSTFMDEAISSLLNQIDSDKTVGPYINFAQKFNNRIIDSLMLSIYQMVDNGEDDNQFSEFDLLFSNVREKYQDELINNKQKALDVVNSFPLFGAGGITIALSMSIISIIGDYVNVI